MARVLIAGCGWLGEALGATLARARRHRVGAAAARARLPTELHPIEADLADPRTLTRLPSPARRGGFRRRARSRATKRRTSGSTFAASPTCSTRCAVGAGRRSCRRAIVLLSSTSVYGQTAGEWVDETSATTPTDFRGRIVLRGEETLLASGLPAIALRLGGLYGPGRESLIDAVRDGRATLAPAPARFTNRIHRDDAVGAIVHLLDLAADAVARVYLGVDEEPADRNDVLRWLAARLGVVLEEAAPGAQRRGDARSDSNKRCSSARLRGSGYRFRYPSYREGYDAILRSGQSTEPPSAPDR